MARRVLVSRRLIICALLAAGIVSALGVHRWLNDPARDRNRPTTAWSVRV